MGAGIAAGPHCPFAVGYQAWEARQSARAVSKPGLSRGLGQGSWSPSAAEATSGFPGGSPSGPKPWRFAAWRIESSRFRSRRPHTAAEALVRLGWILGRSLGSAGQSMDRSPGSCRVTSRWPKPRFPSEPVLDARASGVRTLRVRRPKALVPVGASRSLPPLLPLKGKPEASAWRRLRQPPCLCDVTSCLVGQEARSLGLWPGRLSNRCRPIVSATTRSCHENRVAPNGIRLWKTRITGISAHALARLLTRPRGGQTALSLKPPLAAREMPA